MIRRREPQLKKGWSESFIDDTNFIEKIAFIMWFGMIGIFYIMFDMLDIWIRILISIGSFTISSIIIYWFGNFMSSEERHWN
tara:strand:- start:131 stop:376 length:246 start_codon:yes stop_codon:yes gene_type:complete